MRDYFAKAMRIALSLCLVVCLTPVIAFGDEGATSAEVVGEEQNTSPPAGDAIAGVDAATGGETQATDAEPAAQPQAAAALATAAAEQPQAAAAEPQMLATAETPSFSGGVGTDVDPYLISNAEDMWALSDFVATGDADGLSFKVTADIDLGCSESNQWVPIGDTSLCFAGTFDGGNHVISGLYIKGSAQDVGLFGVARGATIKNFVLRGYVEGASRVGGVCAYSNDGSQTVDNVFENIGNEATVSAPVNTGSRSAGGIVGYATNWTTVRSCWNTGTISSNQCAGGIVGFTFYKATITDCYNAGDVSAQNYSGNYTGGILGWLNNGNSGVGTISNCYNVGSVVNGIYGMTNYTYPVSNCYCLSGASMYAAKLNATFDGIAFVDEAEMKGAALASALGGSYMSYAGEYPLLVAQAPYIGAPAFAEQPQDAEFVLGESVPALSVVAQRPTVGFGVEGTLTYQWYQSDTATNMGGTALEGETYTSLTPAIDAAGVTYYYCVATNSYDKEGVPLSKSTTSDVASLTASEGVNAAAPVILAQPLGQSIGYARVPDALTIAAEVTGSGAGVLSYQWYENTENAVEGAAAIEGATGMTYVPQTVETGVTYYFCEVTNNFPGTTTSASVRSDIVAFEVLDVVEVATAEELAAIAANSRAGASYEGVTVRLVADIDLSSVCSPEKGGWDPIGASTTFRGTFDGGYHAIANLYYTNPRAANVGLFCVVNGATLKNFVVSGTVECSTSSYVGTVVAQATSTTIENVGSTVRVQNTGGGTTGGIAGYTYLCTISNCYNAGTIEAAGQVGGLFGTMSPHNFVRNCYNAGSVTSTGTGAYAYAGGIAGFMTSIVEQDASLLSNCYNSGIVTSEVRAGSLIGSDESGATVKVDVKYVDNLYLSGSTPACGNRESDPAGCTAVDEAALKAAASTLGSAYVATDGYPALAWQGVVSGAPLITAQPQDGQCAAGSEATPLAVSAVVPATAAQGGTLSYQWHSNATASIEGATAIEGATQASYVPPSATAGVTYYYCVVTNTFEQGGATAKASSTSDIAMQAVTSEVPAAMPAFTQQPQGQDVAFGGTPEALHAAAAMEGAGAGTLSYQWYSNATASTEGAVAIEGATSGDYAPAATMGTTYYYCVATNTFEGVKTAAAQSDVACVDVSNVLAIGTAAELVDFGKSIAEGNTYKGVEVRLVADISLADSGAWAASGGFAGTFNGCYHVISGFSSTTGGLFAELQLGAVVENFVLKGSIDATLSSANAGTTPIGAIANEMRGGSGAPVEVRNVGSEVNITIGTSGGAHCDVAGIVGRIRIYTGTQFITGCYNRGTIAVNDATGYWSYVGGILAEGNSSAATVVIDSCYNAGSITVNNNGGIQAGGIVAYRGTVRNCYGVGVVNRSGSALAYSQCTITNSYFPNTMTSGNGGTALADADMRGTAFAERLGSAYVGVDGGYPRLAWEGLLTTIVTQPQGAVYVQDAPAAALTVEASMPEAPNRGFDGTLSYQWHKGTQADFEVSEETAIEGATVASYTPSTATAGTAFYVCVVTNTHASGTDTLASSSAAIAVLASAAAPVSVGTQPQDASYTQGDSADLVVEASLGDGQKGTLSYQWYVSPTNSNAGGAIIPGATEPALSVDSLDLGDAYYYCVASNAFDGVAAASTASSCAKVTVNAFTIKNATELQAFAQLVNDGNTFAGYTVRLTADIDLSSVCGQNQNWTRIGTSFEKSFRGTFDGQGHEVSNLYFWYDSSVALFGYIVNATIENLVVSGQVNGSGNYAAGVAAYAYNGNTFINVGNKASVRSSSYVGGICGTVATMGGYPSYGTTFTRCFNTGSITATGTTGSAGGISASSGSAVSCYNTGAITGMSPAGIAVYGSEPMTDCYNAGAVTRPDGTTTYTGPINVYTSYVSSGTNNYGLEGASGTQGIAATMLDEAAMQSASFVDQLNVNGASYVVASGYPQLAWEAEAGRAFISAQPVSAAYVQGERAAALAVAASVPTEGIGSNGTLGYQWYQASSAAANPAADEAIQGATGASLDVQTYDMAPGNHYYYCVVTNSFDGSTAAITSLVATISISTTIDAIAPTFVLQPSSANYSLDAGTPSVRALNVVVSPTEGTGFGEIAYQWYKAASGNAEGAPIANATGTSYTPGVASAGTSYYYCVATNTFEGSKTASTRSDVARIVGYTTASAAPVLGAQPGGTSRYTQGDVAEALSVQASLPSTMPGNGGTLGYQWYRNTTGVANPAVDEKVSGATRATYAPDTSLTANVYYYYCVATNSFYVEGATAISSVTSTVACVELVSTISPLVPVVSTTDTPATYDQGALVVPLGVTATVEGAGAGDLSYQWFRSSDDVVSSDDEQLANATEATYAPATVGLAAGTNHYYCRVTNTFEKVKEATATSTPIAITVNPTLAIYTADDLRALRDEVNAGTTYAGLTIELLSDIDLEGSEDNPWSSIGNNSNRFEGIFKGNGHVVSGLYQHVTTMDNSNCFSGLFGYVRDASLSDMVVEGSILIETTYTSDFAAGGVVGQAGNTKLTNLGSMVDIYASTTSTGSTRVSVGGVVGSTFYVSGGSTIIAGCYNKGSLEIAHTDTWYRCVGGIAGNDSYGTYSECYNQGAVVGGSHTGGIAGYTTNGTTVRNCYNTGAVRQGAASRTGLFYGGIVGCTENNYVMTFANNHYLDSTSDLPNSGGPNATDNVAETAAALQQQGMVGTLNADRQAFAYNEGGYPTLAWESDLVVNAPVFSAQPADGTYAPQGTIATALVVQATVAGENRGTLSYQWYVNDAATTVGATPVEGATAAACSPSTAEPGLRYYYCVATHAYRGVEARNVSNIVSFQTTSATEAAQPAFVTQPQGTTYGVGGLVADLSVGIDLVAGGEGVGDITYQWYANAEDSVTGAEAIEGATQATYKPSVAAAGTTYYFCEVTNTFESVKVKMARSDMACLVVNDTLVISNASGMKAFAEAVNAGVTFEGCTVLLSSDIDLSTVCGDENGSWTPIGFEYATSFRGTFDGQGHRISNLSVSATAINAGLFGYVSDATLKNFVVDGSVYSNSGSVGAVCGSASKSTFENVGNEADVSTASVNYVGGIVGSASSVAFIACYNKGDVRCNAGNTRVGYVGGIAGRTKSTNLSYPPKLVGCYNTGSVSASQAYNGRYFGGLVGNSGSTAYDSCFSTGTVSASRDANAALGYVSGGTFTNNYYQQQSKTDAKFTVKTEAELMAVEFVATLNDSTAGSVYKAAAESYPQLYWEGATYMAGFSIEPATIADQAYTGSAIKPAVTVKDAAGQLVDASSYVVSYRDNVNTGVATVVVQGTGAYYGTMEKAFNITGTSLEGATIAAIADQAYTAFPSMPALSVSYGETPLVEGKDYTTTYANNVEAGQATATISGMGAYSGTKSATFNVVGSVPANVVIGNVHDLQALSEAVANGHSGEGITFVLASDLDLSSACSATLGSWTPIGTSSTLPFKGTFKGNGHAIRGLYINVAAAYQGLFGYVRDAVITDLSVEGTVTITDNNSNAAGIVGYARASTLENLCNKAAVSLSYDMGGGIAGRAYVAAADTNEMIIRNCTNKATITAATNGTGRIGGIVGYAQGASATVMVVVENCYNQGNMTLTDAYTSWVGGVVGQLQYASLDNCYTTGTVSGGSETDNNAIVGYYSASQVSLSNNYYLAGAIGHDDPAGTSKTEPELKAAGFVSTLNNGGTSYKVAADAYPLLFWEGATNMGACSIDAVADQEWTGSELTPALVVKAGESTLSAGTDYTVAYGNNVSTGTATATVTGKGAYYGTASTTFAIVGTNVADAALSGVADSYAYTGGAIRPAVVLTYGTGANAQVLVADTDYAVAYSNNVNAGQATLVVSGMGKYSGSISKTFDITETAISTAVAAAIPVQPWTGAACTPVVTLTVGEGDAARTLVADTDYTVEYVNNVNEGQATITVTGLGDFTGTKDVNFDISRIDLADAVVGGLAEGGYNYTGSAITPVPTVELDGRPLIYGVDFTLSYESNVAVSATAPKVMVNAVPTSSYKGSASASFIINESDFGQVATVAAIADQTWTGSVLKPAVEVTIDGVVVSPEDYVVEYSSNTEVGTGLAAVSAKQDTGFAGTVEKGFQIVAANFTGQATVSAVTPESVTYTGGALDPTSVTVTLGGNTLTNGTDYAVACTNNVNVGNATVTATGMGHYAGTAEGSFAITPASLETAVVEVSDATYTGSAIEPAVSVTFNGVVVPATSYEVAYDRNVNAGEALVTVTALEGGNFTVGTSASGSFAIEAASQDAPVGLAHVNESVAGLADGGIFNMTDAMEYKLDSAEAWTPVAAGANRVTGLSAGTYQVRLAADANHEAGAQAKVKIVALIKPSYVLAIASPASVALDELVFGYAAGSSTTFTITNVGNVPQTGLACAVVGQQADAFSAQLDKTELAVGESATLTVSSVAGLDAAGYAADIAVTSGQNAEGVQASVTQSVVAADISAATVSAVTTPTYTASAQEPALSVAIGDVALAVGTDFTASYSNNVYAGTANVAVEGTGNYVGSASGTFAISPAFLVVKAADKTKDFGADDPELTYVAQGLQGTDAMSGVTLIRSAGESAGGHYPIVPMGGVVSAGNETVTSSYAITYQQGTLSIGIPNYSENGWLQLAGDTRYGTMAAIVEEAYPDSCDTVILTRGDVSVDALGASALAGALDCPVITTTPTALDASARAEIERLGASNVYILGSSAAVSDAVFGEVAGIIGKDPVRVFGDGRVDTSIAVGKLAKELGGSDTCFVTKGWSWDNVLPDALSAAPYAYATKSPVFLVNGDGSLPAAVASAIEEGGYERVVIIGSEAAVSSDAEAQLGGIVGEDGVDRQGGATRYETSAVLAQWSIDQGVLSAATVAVTRGDKDADALVSSALCGKRGGVLLLVGDGATTCIDGLIATAGESGIIERGYFLGSDAAVSTDLQRACVAASGIPRLF